jgi:hypothetical protein
LKSEKTNKLNNFILVDGISYWIESSYTTMARYTKNDKVAFKACVNFKDILETNKLKCYIKNIEEQIEEKEVDK